MPRKHEDGQQIGNILRRQNGNWTARVKYKGRQIWRTAPTKEAAQKLLGELREDIARDRVALPRRSRKTLSQWIPEYMKWAKNNKRSWRDDQMRLEVHLEKAFGSLKLSDITKQRVIGYMEKRRTKVSPATVNREVAILRRLLSHAVERGEIQDNPLRGIKMYAESTPRLPSLSLEAEARLLAACPPWLVFVARLAVLTGMRRGELLALRWKHVDFHAGILTVEDSKAGKPRHVPIHPAARAELTERYGPKGQHPEPGDPVIIREDGKAPQAKAVSDGWRAATKRAGGYDSKTDTWQDATFRGLRFHDLRHVAATRLLAKGASLPEVAALTGHKTLHMANRYAHTSIVRLSDLVSRMPVASIPVVPSDGGTIQ